MSPVSPITKGLPGSTTTPLACGPSRLGARRTCARRYACADGEITGMVEAYGRSVNRL